MKTNKILMIACFLIGLIGSSGCKDDDFTEITTLDVPRAFSPTELQAIVVNRTGVRLTWKAVNNADSYKIEFFDNAEFSGNPVRSIDNISFEQVPYTVSGLLGETTYSVRVKAIGTDVDDSKWVSATFSTDAEQIFQNINLETLTATSVTLNWPAGEAASTITLTPGNITHTVTSAEVAAGQATISGLTPETAYTAKLMNGTRVRGTMAFTTLLDLGGAIAVKPGDDLLALVANASAGDVFALMPGTYNVNAELVVNKSISIKGAKPASKPIINGLVFKIKGNAGLSLKDLTLIGAGATVSNQAIIYDEASDNAYGPLVVQDCDIQDYDKGLMYVNVKARIEEVTFSGNIIKDIKGNGGDFIDFRNGIANTLLFENNTVYNSVEARDLFRMDGGGSTNFPGVTSVITIRTNTFFSVSKANRFLYIRLASHQIHFTKNLIAESNGYYTNQPLTTITSMANNNYFNAPNFTASTTSNAKNDTGTFTKLDPGFTNAAAGDFTISNVDLKANGIGDSRWR